MTAIEFKEIYDKVAQAGYEEEIEWQRNLKPCDNSKDFFHETCWVIINSGMKEQIARKIWERIQIAWEDGKTASSAFNHPGKTDAIEYVRHNRVDLFYQYQLTDAKIEFLETIPFIGKITKYHLAKNLGFDCCKPDRHIVRVAAQYNQTPDEFCRSVSEKSGEKICVVDIVIWRACNLGFL